MFQYRAHLFDESSGLEVEELLPHEGQVKDDDAGRLLEQRVSPRLKSRLGRHLYIGEKVCLINIIHMIIV